MNDILIENQYLPPISYFVAMSKSDKTWLEMKENYVKQSYRNRCQIKGANGVQDLSIPIKEGTKKRIIDTVEIDYKHKWTNNHWRAIASAYGNAPFFEFYSDDFKKIFDSKPRHLVTFTQSLLTICLKALNISPMVGQTQHYSDEEKSGLSDLRSAIHPKKPRARLVSPEYLQVFGKEFATDLSIIDLLFCEGPNAGNIISNSTLTFFEPLSLR